MKFNNPSLTKALIENAPRLIAENEKLDKISSDIRLLEKALKNLNQKSKNVHVLEGLWIMWDSSLKKIMCNNGSQEKPLLECKKEIRIECYPFLEELLKK